MKKSDHQWIQDVLDGQCDGAQFAAFQQRLRDDQEFAQLYREYALMQHALYEEFEGRAMIGARQVAPTKSSRPRWIGWSAVAAALVIGLVIFSQRDRGLQLPQRWATSVFSDDAQWLINGKVADHTHEVQVAEGARVQLLLGQARFSIDGIVQSVIDAPAEWTYSDEMKITWHRGVGRFRVEDSVQGFTVETSTMSVVDLGTEFGVSSTLGGEAEVHVIEGLVSVNAGQNEPKTLAGGEAVRLNDSGTWKKIPLQMKSVSELRESFVTLVDEDFSDVSQEYSISNRKARYRDDRWRLDRGKALVQKGRIEGRSFEAFLPLKIDEPSAQRGVLLVTMAVENPHTGAFHTDGWSGLSLYRAGEEVVFFGDGYGPEKTWSLDVRQQLPLVLPKHAVIDGRTVTLRYDAASGAVSLHHGGLPLGPAFCESKIAAGIRFDEVRLSASEEAALAVRSLQVRSGGVTR